jgi:biopolymer transport protein ExbD
MLTTTFSPEKTTVELPQSEIRTEVPKDAAIIAITQEGIIRFTDGERPSFALGTAAELGPLTQEVVRWLPDREFVIKADRMVRYELIDAVLEQLRLNGATKIGLLTERKTGGGV